MNPNDVRFRGGADIGRRIVPIISDATDPNRTWAGSKSRRARPTVAAGSIGVSVHVNEAKSLRRSTRSRRCRPFHSH